MGDALLALVLVVGTVGPSAWITLELRAWWQRADTVALFIVEGSALTDCEAGRAFVVFGIAPTPGPRSFGITQRAPGGVQ